MNGYRKAALTLHGLSPVDRRWLLDRLAETQREQLQPLLSELDELGARFDPEDIAGLTDPSPLAAGSAGTSPVPALSTPAPTAEPAEEAVAGIDAAVLAATLATEPDWAVAAVLGSASAPLRERLLAALDPQRADSLATSARDATAGTVALPSTLPPTLSAALFAALARCAAERAGGSAGRIETVPAAGHERAAPPPSRRRFERMPQWLK